MGRMFFAALSLFLLLRLLAISSPCPAQTPAAPSTAEKVDSVFLVSMAFKPGDSVEKVFTNRYDVKRALMTYTFEDSIYNLEDVAFGEDPIEGPDCFIPELKLAFKYYTYVISLYCTSVRKYKNSAPYRASSVRMKNDLPITQTVYDYLIVLRDSKLGKSALAASTIAQMVKTDEIEDPNEDLKDLEQALKDDDSKDTDDKDLTESGDFNKQLDGEDVDGSDLDLDEEGDEIIMEDEDMSSKGLPSATKPATGGATPPKPATPAPAGSPQQPKPAAPAPK
jgi:hypothetical protein